MNDIRPAALRVKKEAPTYANCSQRVIVAAVRDGSLPTFKLGQSRLVRIEALDKWMRSKERAGVARADSAIVKRIGGRK
jgi:excisionase family DNA binding protein